MAHKKTAKLSKMHFNCVIAMKKHKLKWQTEFDEVQPIVRYNPPRDHSPALRKFPHWMTSK